MESNGTALATRAQDGARAMIAGAMRPYMKAMGNVLPRHLTPERMLSLTLVAAVKTPKLLECTPESIALAVLRVAQWGLEIGSTAHLVPFYDRKAGGLVCTPIAAWQGLVEMILRSPHVRDIWTTPVYEGETFRVTAGIDPMIHHEPAFSDDRRELTHVYAVARLKGNQATFEVMSRGQIDRVRAAAPQPDSPGWKNHFDEMARKTVLRRIAKRLPQLPATVFDAVDADDAPEFAARVAPDATATVVEPVGLRRLTGLPPVVAAPYGDEPTEADTSDEALAAMADAFRKSAESGADPYEGAAGPTGFEVGGAPAVKRRSAQSEGR